MGFRIFVPCLIFRILIWISQTNFSYPTARLNFQRNLIIAEWMNASVRSRHFREYLIRVSISSIISSRIFCMCHPILCFCVVSAYDWQGFFVLCWEYESRMRYTNPCVPQLGYHCRKQNLFYLYSTTMTDHFPEHNRDKIGSLTLSHAPVIVHTET